MDRVNNTLKVKITGKNQQGEPFQEIATLEQFGNFGVLIYTAQPLRLSDRVHICGANGEPLASAEVVWVRAGTTPAVEALLHRSLEPAEAVLPTGESVPPPQQPVSAARNGMASSTPTAGSPPAPTSAPPATSSGKSTVESLESNTRASGSFGKDRALAPATKRPSSPRERREEVVEAKPTKQAAQEAAQNRAQLATLEQYRKMAFAALVVLTILFIAALAPIGSSAPTQIEILEQKGCVEINNVVKAEADETATGDLECWTEANNGAVQFIRREDITIGQLALELGGMRREGSKASGYWCPKGESKLVENPSASQLPETLASVWSLKPVGVNAATLGELTLQWKDQRLLFKEASKQSVLDRTQDISKVIYYAGLQKFVVKLNDSATTVDAPVLRELIFYPPTGQNTVAAAEGQLTNSTWQTYLAQSGPQQSGLAFGFRQIASLLLGLGIAATLVYLAINYYRSRTITAAG